MGLLEMHPLDQDPQRCKQEIALMEAKTGAVLGPEYEWAEKLRSRLTGRPYEVRVTYPRHFPLEAPKAFIRGVSLDGSPHRLVDGSLCLFSDHSRGVGPGTSALLVRNRAVVWFWVFEVWERTGEWMPNPAFGWR